MKVYDRLLAEQLAAEAQRYLVTVEFFEGETLRFIAWQSEARELHLEPIEYEVSWREYDR